MVGILGRGSPLLEGSIRPADYYKGAKRAAPAKNLVRNPGSRN